MTIRKEIALRRKELISNGFNSNNALNIARQEANKKHNKDWRHTEGLKNCNRNFNIDSKEPSIYDSHIHGEHWID